MSLEIKISEEKEVVLLKLQETWIQILPQMQKQKSIVG